MIRTLVLFVATVYAGPYVHQPLYCDQGSGLVYDVGAVEPWVALPASEHGVSWWCGDLVYLSGVDAEGQPWSLMARALDAGPLAGYCVMVPNQSKSGERECVPIGADIPAPFAPFAGMSATVERFVNVSAEARRWRE